jgi:hypothetical protein
VACTRKKKELKFKESAHADQWEVKKESRHETSPMIVVMATARLGSICHSFENPTAHFFHGDPGKKSTGYIPSFRYLAFYDNKQLLFLNVV